MSDLTLTPREWLLLQWLSKEESSAYGECEGEELDALKKAGLCEVDIGNGVRYSGYERVRITDAGRAALKDQRT